MADSDRPFANYQGADSQSAGAQSEAHQSVGAIEDSLQSLMANIRAQAPEAGEEQIRKVALHQLFGTTEQGQAGLAKYLASKQELTGGGQQFMSATEPGPSLGQEMLGSFPTELSSAAMEQLTGQPLPGAPQPSFLVNEPSAPTATQSFEGAEAAAMRSVIDERRALEAQKAAEAAGQAAREEAQGLKYQKAALMMMQQAAEPIGPRTIGEAMSGKYGQAAAQSQQDINIARQFFGERGKIQRGAMKEAEYKRKSKRFEAREQRLKTQGERGDTTRREVAMARDKTRTETNAASIVSRELIAANRLSELGNRMKQNSAITRARVNQGWSRLDMERLGTNREGRHILEIQADKFLDNAQRSQQTARTHADFINRIDKQIAKVRDEMEWSNQYNESDLIDLNMQRDSAERQREAAIAESNTFQKAAAKATRGLSEYQVAPQQRRSGRTRTKKTKVTSQGLMN